MTREEWLSLKPGDVISTMDNGSSTVHIKLSYQPHTIQLHTSKWQGIIIWHSQNSSRKGRMWMAENCIIYNIVAKAPPLTRLQLLDLE